MLTDLARRAAETTINGLYRGVPPGCGELQLSDVGKQRWSVPAEDLSLPVLTLSEPAFAHNIRTINQYAAEQGVFLCAHGKTMMAPQLLERVLEGSRTVGLCAATTQQAAVMAACGASKVFIANQVVGRANLGKLAELVWDYPGSRFLVLVDSVAGVEQLLAHAAPLPSDRPLDLLIEVGVPQGRAGVRDLAAAKVLMQHIAVRRREGAPVRLGGVSTYEGAVPGGADNLAEIERLFALTRDVYAAALLTGLAAEPRPILSAGGSATFDLVARAFVGVPFDVVPEIWLRPGVAPVYDHVIYQERLAQMDARGGLDIGGDRMSAVASFQPALAVWAAVQSILDGEVALLAAGIRDFPADAGYPTLLAYYRSGQLVSTFPAGRHSLTKANDQHGYLPLEGLALEVGDVLKLGISHPCTTFDKWPVLFVVDGKERVVDAVRTYF